MSSKKVRGFNLGLSAAVMTAIGLGMSATAFAQTAPGTASPGSPFEVWGALYSGSAPSGYPMGDGWAQGASYLGVLDDDGNATRDGSGIPFRAALSVDGNWGNMGDGLDTTLFSGSNKNSALIGPGDKGWDWDMGDGGPQKNDITNTYFHTRVDPVTGDRWVFVGAETRSINGDSHADFEFNQAGVIQVGETDGELIGLGPDGGRTVDDFLITIDFETGGESPVASIRFWDGGSFVLVSVPDSVYSAANLVDIDHPTTGTWTHYTGDGAETSLLTRLQFVEGAANLTALGIAVDPCSPDATFMVKTRSSSSWTSDLKDYALVYFPLEPPPVLELTAPELVCAGETFEVTATETTGLHNAAYRWSVTGCGSIISDPTADTITIEPDPNCDCAITAAATITGGECLHVVTSEITVTVQDITAPDLSDGPSDVTVECDAITDPEVLTATDDCSEPVVERAELVEPGICFGDSTITRTWTATDNCDNQSVHTQVVTVEDTTAPELAGVPADEAVECDSIPTPAEVTATDNCSTPIVEFAESTTPGACMGDSAITRTWTALDECGNETSESQTITVTDSTAPELIGVPPDVTAECDALPPAAEVTATDNCSDPAVQLAENTEPGSCIGESMVIRTWTAADDCANETSQVQIVTLIDTTPPTLVGVPADATVECDSVPDPPVVTATDNCSDPIVELVETIEPGPFIGLAVITRTWTATDDCGNQTSQSQVLTVVDTTAPVLIGVPPDETVECDAVPPPAVVTATDNCSDPTVELTEQTEPGACDGQRTITRTWTATDASGNQTSATQVITVIDTTDPALIGVPPDETVECDAIPAPPEVTATDNCSSPTVEYGESEEPGDCPARWTITRTWTATDSCGNASTYVQILTVVDTTAPVLSDDPEDITAECDAVPNPVTLSAGDNCDPDVPVEFAEVSTAGICLGDYLLDRTWSAADDCGNTASVDQLVSVQDTTPPVVTMQPNGTQFICDGEPVQYVADTNDNCVDSAISAYDLMTITADSGEYVFVAPLPGGGLTITVTGPAWVSAALAATDDCYNASDVFEFTFKVLLGWEACSQGFWKNHPDLWGPSDYSPDDKFLDAFQITDLSSPEITSGFDRNMTLFTAINRTSDLFNQALVQGVAALLNASYPELKFPITVRYVIETMQAAFAGEITFEEAHRRFTEWNAAEKECGCPVE